MTEPVAADDARTLTRSAARKIGRRRADVSLVAEGIKRWRLQNDPASDFGPTLAEYLVLLLDQEGRLR